MLPITGLALEKQSACQFQYYLYYSIYRTTATNLSGHWVKIPTCSSVAILRRSVKAALESKWHARCSPSAPERNLT